MPIARTMLPWALARRLRLNDVPDSSYTLSGSTLTVNPQVFGDLAADNEVEIEIAYKIADGDVADDATYVIDNTATITITGQQYQASDY